MAEASEKCEGGRECDPMERAAVAVDDLYHVKGTFFPLDPSEKTSRLQSLADLALRLIDLIPSSPEVRKPPLQRAQLEYLRGKTLDAFSDYRKEAEDHLSKAVKLNPSLADAWLCLGNCIWKKGNLSAAKNCYKMALCKGPNKHILCQLSMLERQLGQGTEHQAQSVEESIRCAKEAIMLDVKDGNSWYNLGNAYLTSFFVTGAWDQNKLLLSVKAYQNAEKDEQLRSNPDLFYNCATADKYLDNYERALSGFEAASLKDPGLHADVQVQQTVNTLEKIENSLRWQAKEKRLSRIISSLAKVPLNTPHKKATIDTLSEGLNKAVAVVGRVLLLVKHDGDCPLYYVICDLDGTCFILSVYGLLSHAVKEGDQVTLLEPCYKPVDFSWKCKQYKFKLTRVDFREQILVNGKMPDPEVTVRASISAQHKA